jgi:hypothetical protein
MEKRSQIQLIVIILPIITDSFRTTPKTKMRLSDSAAPQVHNFYFYFMSFTNNHRLLRYLLLGMAIAAIVYLHPSWGGLALWLLDRFAGVYIDSLLEKGIEFLSR